MVKPKFIHNCESCVFLGHFEMHDLYVCREKGKVGARFDNDDVDCKWWPIDVPSPDKHLTEARRRALLFKVRGFVREVEVPKGRSSKG